MHLERIQTLKLQPPAPCGARWSWSEPGEPRHARRESGTVPAFSAGSSTVPSTAALLQPLCLSPSCLPRPLSCSFPSRWHCPPHRDGALGRIRCCRHKERFSHYRFRIEGMRGLVFHPLIYRGLMVVSTIIPRLHIKSSLLLKATQWRQSFSFHKCSTTGNTTKAGTRSQTSMTALSPWGMLPACSPEPAAGGGKADVLEVGQPSYYWTLVGLWESLHAHINYCRARGRSDPGVSDSPADTVWEQAHLPATPAQPLGYAGTGSDPLISGIAAGGFPVHWTCMNPSHVLRTETKTIAVGSHSWLEVKPTYLHRSTQMCHTRGLLLLDACPSELILQKCMCTI